MSKKLSCIAGLQCTAAMGAAFSICLSLEGFAALSARGGCTHSLRRCPLPGCSENSLWECSRSAFSPPAELHCWMHLAHCIISLLNAAEGSLLVGRCHRPDCIHHA